MADTRADAVYACINMEQAAAPDNIKVKSICIDADIGKVVSNVLYK